MAMLRYRTISLATVVTILSLLLGFQLIRTVQCQKLGHSNKLLESDKVVVGINLSPSAGAIAVDFDNGTVWTHAVSGNQDYLEAMARYASPESQHPSPPYDFGEWLREQWRVFQRNRRKQAGLPATPDVGILADVVRSLREEAEEALQIKVAVAAVSTPSFVGIYPEDVRDTLEHVGVEYIGVGYWPVVDETTATYAGHGLGLCKHYRYREQCWLEEEKISRRVVLSVHYARNVLTFSIGEFAGVLLHPSWIGYKGDFFELGSEKAHMDGSVNEEYWNDLQQVIDMILEGHVVYRGPLTTITFAGESAPSNRDDRFARLLLETLKQYQPLSHEIFMNDPLHVAAKGTAELAKRSTAISAVSGNEITFDLEL